MRKMLLAAFREKFGGDAEWIVRSPGRVNLIGEHTDYNGGFAMPMAVERATWVALRRRVKPGARLFSFEFSEWAEAVPGWAKRKSGAEWKQFLGGATEEMAGRFTEVGGWEGMSVSNLPVGAGLSSSASFTLALLRAFAAVSEIPWEAREMALLAHAVEVEWVGVNCGKMDQLAVALGRKDHALLLDCRSLESREFPLPEGTRIVILDTTKARTLAGSAYNDRRRECEEAARAMGAESLREISLERFREVEGKLGTDLRKRARHAVSENARVLAAAEAMAAGDAVGLGKLMDESHESLRSDYEVSCRELDAMVAAAREREECLGARMTGAGFGGCAVALVRAEGVERFAENVARRYREETGLEAKIYATGAADGCECERI